MIKVWGSLMSQYLVILRVYFIYILCVIIYYLELFYYNCLLFNFRNKYDERL